MGRHPGQFLGQIKALPLGLWSDHSAVATTSGQAGVRLPPDNSVSSFPICSPILGRGCQCNVAGPHAGGLRLRPCRRTVTSRSQFRWRNLSLWAYR